MQWIDITQSWPRAPLIHRSRGGEMFLWPQTTPQGRLPLPTASSKCKTVITGLKQAKKHGVVLCSTINKPGQVLMSKMQCGSVSWLLLQGVSHQMTILRPTPHREKSKLHSCKYHFSLCTDICGACILWKGEEINWNFLDILSDFDVLWTTKERIDSSNVKTKHWQEFTIFKMS